MQIKTNNLWRRVIDGTELTEKERKEFDYLTDDELIGRDFVRYKGVVYDLHDTMVIAGTVAPHPQRPGWEYWHSYVSDSFSSGVLFRYSSDCEQVQCATYYC